MVLLTFVNKQYAITKSFTVADIDNNSLIVIVICNKHKQLT